MPSDGSLIDEANERLGRIITFYSYKGGTGRTMALANIAWILASNGKRVLAVDWDLESPGLHRYFHPFLRDKELRTTEGLIELIRRYAEATVRKDAPADWFEHLTRVRGRTVSIEWDFPAGGELDFLPAGKQDRPYSTLVSTFDWESFWDRLRGGAYIAALREEMRRQYDYVLLDSRTGLSDTAGICTVQLPDTVVDCFTMSTQGIDGAEAVARSILRLREDIKIYPVPSRVEDAEKSKLDRGRDYARNKFQPFMEALDLPDVEEYWGSVEIPYKPFYAYEEILAVFGDRAQQQNSLLAPFLRLASVLSGEQCTLPAIPDRVRTKTLLDFERRTVSEPLRILIRYAPIDRIWAEWIGQELALVRQHSDLIRADEQLPPLANVDRAAELLSRDGSQWPQSERLWQREADRVGMKTSDFLVPMRVNGPRLPGNAPVTGSVDLPSLREDQAVTAVLEALGVTGPALLGRRAEAGVRRIRYPADAVPHWNVQQTRNAVFTGRDKLLEQVRDYSTSAGDGTSVTALVGLSGVGKTQIALEYVYRFAASYDVVWWIPADTLDQARTMFAQLADRLGIPAGRDERARIVALNEALRQRGTAARWLLVFDNADDPAQFAELLPASGSGDVIITSRNRAWTRRAANHVDVSVFERDESVALLARRGANLDQAGATELAERLGDLPVAVENAGHYLAATAQPLHAYLRILDERLADALSWQPEPGHSQTVTATCKVSMDSLRLQSPAAARLLELFAFLAPRPIPTTMLSGKRIIDLLTEYDPAMRDPLLHGTLIQHAGRYGLARVDTASHGIVMHRLTQQIIREGLTEDVQIKSKAEVHEALAAANPRDADNANNWATYESLRPHVEASGAISSTSDAVRQLIIDMVRYLRLRGFYKASQELAESAMRAWQPLFDPDDVMTLMLRFQLANAIRDLGELPRAYEIDRDVRDRLRRTVGDNHAYTLMVAGSFAQDLRERGEWLEARRLEEDTYSRFREVLGEEHPRTLMAANNYALSTRLAGDYRAALQLDLDTLNRRRRLLGRAHPFTISSANAYGLDLREIGDLTTSRATLDATYGTCRELLGDDHPRTLGTAVNLAVTLRWLGEAERSSALLEETLRQYEKVLGQRHPSTVACNLERACVHADLGEYAEARRISEIAERDFRGSYAATHPMCLAARSDLATFTRRSGNESVGRALGEEVAAQFDEVLGHQHPLSAIALLGVANAAYGAGELEYAKRTDDKVVTRLRARLDDDHPTLITARINQALSGLTPHQYDEGPLGDALRDAERVLGPDHPIAQSARQRDRVELSIDPPIT